MSEASPEIRETSEVAQLAHEVRALRRVVIAILIMTLVFLSISSLQTVIGIPRHAMLFEEMGVGPELRLATRITIRVGSSPLAHMFLAFAPIGSMIWLWLERKRPIVPIFVILCLSAFLALFLVWTRLTLAMPLQQIITGMGDF